MAKLNLQYYTQKDYYSDGDVEDLILKMVEDQIPLDELEPENCNYAILYHLSRQRENILNWYPFQKDADLLEIGAGCGAISGMLCERVNTVTAVELSKRRAAINYTRNKEKTNLEIWVGNLNDMQFPHQYDYVVLNGVLEYAMSFTEGKTPYRSFLNYILSFLKPEGVVLIAIENRLGLKYFAGAPEDHTDSFYLGLNEYSGNDSVRTFSKGELSGLLDECGLTEKRFYYPYPDYKFPNEIFTDETIGTCGYGKDYYNFAENRMLLFDEAAVAESIAKEPAAGVFANSFLVEASRTALNQAENVLYAKMNSDRDPKFQISTSIVRENGRISVYKSPMCELAKPHIKSLHQHANKVINSICSNVSSEETGRGLRYEFLQLDTVAAEVNRLIEKAETEEIKKLLAHVFEMILFQSAEKADYRTEEFRSIFGAAEIQRDVLCVNPANIDLILDNIFHDNGHYRIIDCEWVFDFFVPVIYIIWRVLNELYFKNHKLEALIPRIELERAYDIDPRHAAVFLEWNRNFTLDYVKANQLEHYAKEKIQLSMDHIFWKEKERRSLRSSLYVDYGDGYSEEHKLYLETELKDWRFEVVFQLDGAKLPKRLRWDPVENKLCECRVEAFDGTEWRRLKAANASNKEDDTDVFYCADPWYEISDQRLIRDVLRLRGEIHYLDLQETVGAVDRVSTELHDMQWHMDSLKGEKRKVEEEKRKADEEKQRLEVEKQQSEAARERLEAEKNELDEQYRALNLLFQEETASKTLIKKYVELLEKDYDVLASEKEMLLTEKEKLAKEKEQFHFLADRQKSEISQLEAEKSQVEEQLQMVLNSKGWKLLERLRNLKRKL